ncbi:MAG: EFR1 family ferrodoxin [bacterium]|nr:EFR1 family ferrodoxin [bacterium]
MKILYFTGTGNSLAVAKRFEAELLSIPQMINNNEYVVEDDIVGIIYPVYAFSIPNIVREYLKKCTINSKYTFVIATYGNTAGGSLHEMKKLLAQNGNKADYYEKLLMVDNYLPFFDIDKQLENLGKKNIEENLSQIVDEVNLKIPKRERSGILNNIFSAISAVTICKLEKYNPKMFYVNDECIGCGICKKVCPVGNVFQGGKDKPVFGKECESCLSCTHNCPKNAIKLKYQMSDKRFRNPEVSLNEIIMANESFE